MLSFRNVAFLAVVFITTFLAPLDSKSLLQTSGEAQADILGLKTWCAFCQYFATLNAGELHQTSSKGLTLRDHLMLSCLATDRSQESCDTIVPIISDGFGESTATNGGGFLPSSCVTASAVCGSASSMSEEMAANTVFDFACVTCKRLAQRFFGAADRVASADNIRRLISPFCRAVIFIGGSREECVETITKRFVGTYQTETTILRPKTICQLYGLCVLATRSPSPAPGPGTLPAKLDFAEIEDNQFFGRSCLVCKRIAGAFIGTSDMIVSKDNLERLIGPFCRTASLFLPYTAKECIDGIAIRFEQTYKAGTGTLRPDVFCQWFGPCAFVSPSPSIGTTEMTSLKLSTTK
eukprot:g771.t1